MSSLLQGVSVLYLLSQEFSHRKQSIWRLLTDTGLFLTTVSMRIYTCIYFCHRIHLRTQIPAMYLLMTHTYCPRIYLCPSITACQVQHNSFVLLHCYYVTPCQSLWDSCSIFPCCISTLLSLVVSMLMVYPVPSCVSTACLSPDNCSFDTHAQDWTASSWYYQCPYPSGGSVLYPGIVVHCFY